METAIHNIYVVFAKLCDGTGSAMWRLEADGQLELLCWLNHMWAMAEEFADDSFMEELDSIEEAHDTLAHYFGSYEVWDEYLIAFQEVVDAASESEPEVVSESHAAAAA
jgi:hypothetical protein